tara:strand:- start:3624 stop:6041 length:2418 start_codon:yes stop_codon:yes gene_type:complete
MAFIQYGVGNYNRRNQVPFQSVCPECGDAGTKVSYDALRCFKLYWIPVLPLRRMRVLFECESCGTGSHLPLKKWTRMRDAALAGVSASLGEAPDAKETYLQAAQTYSEYEDVVGFRWIATEALERFPEDVEVLGVLADHYASMLNHPEATDLLRRSLQVADDPDVRLNLAQQLLEQSQVDEARTEVSKVQNEHPDFEPERVAAGLLACDRHVPRRVPGPGDGHDDDLLPRKVWPLWILPSILVIGLLAFGLRTISGTIGHVYVVNGLDRPYEVLVEGQFVSLAAGDRQSLELPFGRIRVEPAPDGEFEFPAEEFVLDVPSMNRAFDGTTLIINPDRCAVLAVQTDYYASSNPKPSEFELVYGGQTFQTIPDVDYHFRPSPDEIELRGSQDQVPKRVLLDLGSDWPLEDRPRLFEQAGEDPAPFASRLLLCLPDDMRQMFLVAQWLDPKVMIDVLRERMKLRPVAVETHRMYQERLFEVEPDHDLGAEYRALLEAEPDDAVLMYLYARTFENEQGSRELLERAVQSPEPCAHAYLGLAAFDRHEGNFEAALGQLRLGLALDPDNSSLAGRETLALLALNRPGEVLDSHSQQISSRIGDLEFMQEMIGLAVRAGRDKRAEELMRMVHDEVDRQGGTQEDHAFVQREFDGLIAMIREDLDGYIDYMSGSGDGSGPFYTALGRKDAPLAALLLDEADGWSHLLDPWLVYVLASHQGLELAETEYLPKALASLAPLGAPGAEITGWFQPGAAIEPRRAVELGERTISVPVLFAALAMRHPDRREEFLGHSRLHNYELPALRLLLNTFLAD